MPELPEVETLRRSLAADLPGRTITGARFGSFPEVVGPAGPVAFVAGVPGRTIAGLRRRGKYLLLDLDDGTALLVHLRMTGQLVRTGRGEPPLRFEHLALELDDGTDLRFADQRKFGRMLHVAQADLAALGARLGPEPLDPDFTVGALAARLANRQGKLKSLLLDQRIVAGLGNIYVDEALFRAGLHPERPAGSLSLAELERLHAAIVAVLSEGIGHRGTSFASFLDGHGQAGENQGNLRVYGRGRAGLPCPRCGTALIVLVVGGRSSHLCPTCQPPQ